jgi:hypothetical protein
MTVLRSVAIFAVAYALARSWPTPDRLVLDKLAGLSLVVQVAF